MAPFVAMIPTVSEGSDGVTKITVQGGYIIVDEKTYTIIVFDNPSILDIHRKLCELIDRKPSVGLDLLTDEIFSRVTDRIFDLNPKWNISDSDVLKFTGGTIRNRNVFAYKFLAAPIEGTRYYADSRPIQLDWNREYRTFHPVQQFIATNDFSAQDYLCGTSGCDNVVPL